MTIFTIFSLGFFRFFSYIIIVKQLKLILIVIVGLSCSAIIRGPASDKLKFSRREISSHYVFPNISEGGKKIKVAFFDADSTLRVSKSGSVSANDPQDVYLLPCVADRLKLLAENNFLIAIVSNQGGVPKVIPYSTAEGALLTTVNLIAELGGMIHYYDFAEGNGEKEDRKPGIGMALRLEKMLQELGYELDKEHSFMVGDSAYKKDVDVRPDGRPGTHFSNADRLFAENYFSEYASDVVPYRFEEANVFFGWAQNGVDVFQEDEVLGLSGMEMVKEYLKKYKKDACPTPQSKLF